jgi:hypothetical protein
MISLLRWLALAAVLLGAAPAAQAQVTASLSSKTGQVGAPLQLQYQFLNVGRPGDMPRSLMVDGLEIRLTGRAISPSRDSPCRSTDAKCARRP